MKTIIVDDERWMLKAFMDNVAGIQDADVIGMFIDPLQALDFAQHHEVDLAFLDIEMPHMNGLELCQRLREMDPKVIVVFLSAYEQYMPEAFTTQEADYYILKPYKRETLQAAFARASLLSARQHKSVQIETFGRFCVTVEGAPLKLTSAVATEILALLVHKCGTVLSSKEAFYLMWEDRPCDHEHLKAYHKGMRKLKDTLESAGIGQLLIPVNGNYKLDRSLVECDLYRFLRGDAEAVRKYQSIYMPDYSWGEESIGNFNTLKEQFQLQSQPRLLAHASEPSMSRPIREVLPYHKRKDAGSARVVSFRM